MMSNISDLDIIHMIWQGPLTLEGAQATNAGSDYGVYQIYDTHDVSGPDTLLYIGQRPSTLLAIGSLIIKLNGPGGTQVTWPYTSGGLLASGRSQMTVGVN